MAKSAKIGIVGLLIAVSLSACVSSPSERFARTAASYGLHETTFAATQFNLTLFHNQSSHSAPLHVYLAGDGQPFHRNRYTNPDPTSQSSVVLELIRHDPNQSVLIGRPCYHQTKDSKNCNSNKWWTSHRYSPEIVTAIAEAIMSLNTDGRPIRLIGFSGGGSLAVLVAPKLNNVVAIVTINANLDIQAWTEHHQYTPLYGSLNPIKLLPTLNKVPQWHLYGRADQNVNPEPWLPTLREASQSRVFVYSNYTHRCCWADIWNKFLVKHFSND